MEQGVEELAERELPRPGAIPGRVLTRNTGGVKFDAAAGQVNIINYLNGDRREWMIKDILHGMSQAQKSIPAKYFYDARGSQLFEEICRTPEYYPTETELSILDKSAGSIMQFFSAGAGSLVELGSGSNRKVRKLLDAVSPSDRPQIRYVPVDISQSCLLESAIELRNEYDGLQVLGVVADFTEHMEVLPRGRKLIAFFGSTIGNFTGEEAVVLLRRVREVMNPEDRLLLGMDMVKPIAILEAAYNDREGFTREFNRNILHHVNSELKANFDPKSFEHVAFFNAREERVEMHLRAQHLMRVHIEDLRMSVKIKEGETIHTEICRKFSPKSAGLLFDRAGLSIARSFFDPRGWFSLVELKPIQ